MKSKRSKATDIPKKVKEAVFKRDGGMCVNKCGRPGIPNAHYIRRSQNGLGIEQNIFTACPDCHREQDNGLNSKEYDAFAEKYLKSIYKGCWTKDKLIFRKRRKLKWKIIN